MFFILTIIFSCNNQNIENDQNLESVYSSIKERNLVIKYKEYYAVPVTKGLDRIYIRFPDSSSFFVKNYHKTQPQKLAILKYLNPIDQKVYELTDSNNNALLSKTHNFLNELDELNIIAYRRYLHRSSEHSIFIYTNIIDTTFEYKCKPKYVLIYDTTNTIMNYSEYLFDLEKNITEISDNWYYYSSSLYSKYDKFH